MMKDPSKILIIDDEVQIRRLLVITLEIHGYSLIEAETGREGLSMAASHNPDLVILDLGLPDLDGLEVLKMLREWFTRPVLILSVRNEVENIIMALDQGANDYITKPFRIGELQARIRSALRHSRPEPEKTIYTFGNIVVDIDKRTVIKNNETVHLTATEFSLLSLLARNAGKVLTHHYILKEVWGTGSQEQSQYLRVYIAQLRKKLGDNTGKPVIIITESGIGYRLGD